MKSNLIQALKKLLVAFGGAKDTSEITDTNIVPIVDKLADAVGDFNFESKTTHYLIEKQTINSTTSDTSGIFIENGKKPYLFNTSDYIQAYYAMGRIAENEENESILKSFIQDYFDSHIVLKINDTIVPMNKELTNSSLYGEGALVWTLEEDNYLIGVLFNCDEYFLGDGFRWFSVAGNLETFLPINAEYTIEAYEEITQQKETNLNLSIPTNLNLPEPSEENVGQVLTSLETDEDTYAFGFTTPTSSSDDIFVIDVDLYSTSQTTDNQLGVTFDKSFSEIAAAFATGKRIYAKIQKAYYNPSFIYRGTTLDSIHIRWYQQMLEANRQDKHIIFYEINDVKNQNVTDTITSYIYKVEATMYVEPIM